MTIRFRRLTAAFGAIATLALFASSTPASALSGWFSDPGVLGSSGGWDSQLSFTTPAVTATFTVTGASYKASGDSTCMTTDPCGWWSTDDDAGNHPPDAGDYTASESNSENAYTPSNVKDYEGVTWTWRSGLCSGNFPTTSTPVKTCPNVGTVTIDFDTPVTNAIIHINNLGGNGNFPGYGSRKASGFTTGYDYTLFSQWKLTSGQDMFMLSGGATTNITLAGDVIRNRFTPQGLGARVSTKESDYNDASTFYDNGTGSGSFLVAGTYSQITFDIDLKWALVNYGDGTPQDEDIPEGVSVQLSFYEGPLPGEGLPIDVPTWEELVDEHEATDLPRTGSSPASPIVAAALIAVGSAMLMLRRRRSLTHETK